MRRAILFLVFALFLAMVIQPNLNKQIKEGNALDLVLLAESLQEKIISDIADHIIKKNGVNVNPLDFISVPR